MPITISKHNGLADMNFAVYHKVDDYYGVLLDGCTVFSGDKEACYDYVNLFIDENTDTFHEEV